MNKTVLKIEIEDLVKPDSYTAKCVYDPYRINRCSFLWVDCHENAVVQKATMEKDEENLVWKFLHQQNPTDSHEKELGDALWDFFSIHADDQLKHQLYDYEQARGCALWLTPREPDFEDPPDYY